MRISPAAMDCHCAHVDPALTIGAMEDASPNDDPEPLVSVLVCTYNAERFIAETLRSVCAQTYRHLDIRVLDNGSVDGTVAVVEDLAARDGRIRLIPGRENRGAYGGLNYLLEQAQGKYVAIQDHDDVWHRDKLRAQIKVLEGDPALVGCGTAIVNHYEKYDRFLQRRQAPLSTIAWHSSLVFRRGPERYDLAVEVGTDFHFMRETLCRGDRRIRNLEEPYVLRRIRSDGSNLSSRWIRGHGRDIWRARIGWFDKLCLLNRLWLPAGLVDRLVLGLILRRCVRTRAEALADPTLRELSGVAPDA